jgi:hypothetical protein
MAATCHAHLLRRVLVQVSLEDIRFEAGRLAGICGFHRTADVQICVHKMGAEGVYDQVYGMTFNIGYIRSEVRRALVEAVYCDDSLADARVPEVYTNGYGQAMEVRRAFSTSVLQVPAFRFLIDDGHFSQDPDFYDTEDEYLEISTRAFIENLSTNLLLQED